MATPLLGEIKMFGGNFAPRGFAFCDGQLLAIAQNTALFSLLGTTYGGDGRTTFALPDLRGRVAMHAGSGPGLTPRPLGQRSGQEVVTLNTSQMPPHNHNIVQFSGNPKLNLGAGAADKDTGNGNSIAVNTTNDTVFTDQPPNANLKLSDTSISMDGVTGTTTNQGGGQGHNNIQPYTVINYIIALQGIFPSRN